MSRHIKLYDEFVNENHFPGPGQTIDVKDLDYDMLDYLHRMSKKLLIDTKTKKGIKGGVGKMYGDFIFNGDTINKKDILRVKIVESLDEANTGRDLNDPVLVTLRASIEDRKRSIASQKERMKNRVYGKQREKLEDQLLDIQEDLKNAYIERRNIFADMDADAGEKGEAWSDNDANEYGSKLNLVDDRIKSLITKRQQIEIKLTF
jgi:hypothetical protein